MKTLTGVGRAVFADRLAATEYAERWAEYWRLALSRIETLRFAVQRVIWDPATIELAILYDREVNGVRDRAAEILWFAPSELVIRGEVFYGV